MGERSITYYTGLEELINDLEEDEAIFSQGVGLVYLYVVDGEKVMGLEESGIKRWPSKYLYFLALRPNTIVKAIEKFLGEEKSSYIRKELEEDLRFTASYLKDKKLFTSFSYNYTEKPIGPRNMGYGYKVPGDFVEAAKDKVENFPSYLTSLEKYIDMVLGKSSTGSPSGIYFSFPGVRSLRSYTKLGKFLEVDGIVSESGARDTSAGFVYNSLNTFDFWRGASFVGKENLGSTVFEFKVPLHTLHRESKPPFVVLPFVSELYEEDGRSNLILVSAVISAKVKVDPSRSSISQIHMLSGLVGESPSSGAGDSSSGNDVWACGVTLDFEKENPVVGREIEVKKNPQIRLVLESSEGSAEIKYDFSGVRVAISGKRDLKKKEVKEVKFSDATMVSSYLDVGNSGQSSREEEVREKIKYYEKIVNILNQRSIEESHDFSYRDLAIRHLLRLTLFDLFIYLSTYRVSGLDALDQDFKPKSRSEYDLILKNFASGSVFDVPLSYLNASLCFSTEGERVSISAYDPPPAFKKFMEDVNEFLESNKEDIPLPRDLKLSLLSASTAFYSLPTLEDIYRFLGLRGDSNSVVKMISGSLGKLFSEEFLDKSLSKGYDIYISKLLELKKLKLAERGGEFKVVEEWDNSNPPRGEGVYPFNPFDLVEAIDIYLRPVTVRIRVGKL